jgi:hypothetical protein
MALPPTWVNALTRPSAVKHLIGKAPTDSAVRLSGKLRYFQCTSHQRLEPPLLRRGPGW